MSGQSNLSFTWDVSGRRMDAHSSLPSSLFCLLQLFLVAAGTARWLPYTFSSFSCSSCVESCRRDFALWFRITVDHCSYSGRFCQLTHSLRQHVCTSLVVRFCFQMLDFGSSTLVPPEEKGCYSILEQGRAHGGQQPGSVFNKTGLSAFLPGRQRPRSCQC